MRSCGSPPRRFPCSRMRNGTALCLPENCRISDKLHRLFPGRGIQSLFRSFRSDIRRWAYRFPLPKDTVASCVSTGPSLCFGPCGAPPFSGGHETIKLPLPLRYDNLISLGRPFVNISSHGSIPPDVPMAHTSPGLPEKKSASRRGRRQDPLTVVPRALTKGPSALFSSRTSIERLTSGQPSSSPYPGAFHRPGNPTTAHRILPGSSACAVTGAKPFRACAKISSPFQVSRRAHGKARGGRMAGHLTDEQRRQA